jgi:malate dehydrogenase
MQGEYGIKDIVCGTIVKLGAGGVQHIYEATVSKDELAKIQAAAEATKELIALLT